MSDPQRHATVQSPTEQSDAGWTLVEMLVALVLLALMSGLLGSALMAARRGLEGVDERSGEATVEAVQGHLRRMLSEASPRRRSGFAVDAPIIETRPASLGLVTAYGPAGQYGGLYAVEIVATAAERQGRFDLSEVRSLYRPPAQSGAPEPAQVRLTSRLLSGVADVQLRYFGIRGDNKIADWGGDWLEPVLLPQLIAVDVTFPAGDRRTWPGLIVALPTGR